MKKKCSIHNNSRTVSTDAQDVREGIIFRCEVQALLLYSETLRFPLSIAAGATRLYGLTLCASTDVQDPCEFIMCWREAQLSLLYSESLRFRLSIVAGVTGLHGPTLCEATACV